MTLSFVFCPCVNNNQIMTGRKALCSEFTFRTSKGPYLHQALGTMLQGARQEEQGSSQTKEESLSPSQAKLHHPEPLNCVQNSA